MGQDLSSVMEQLTKDNILTCSNCRKRYNLHNRMPIMICANQHNVCDECIEEVSKSKKCFECNGPLMVKKKKNQLLCYILNKLSLNEGSSERSFEKNQNIAEHDHIISSKMKRNQFAEIPKFKTIESPEKRAIKIKTVKQQSIPNLNLQLYNEERQFRKKYSVASIFSSTKLQTTSSPPQKNDPETFEQTLNRLSQEHQILLFKNMAANKTDPTTVMNIDLHLNTLPKIFPFLSNFKNLQRLNLTKNRITKIENLGQLKQLTYLSLSQNQIQSIQNLEELIMLKNLYLNKNRIQKIECLNNLTNLQFLGLGFNIIKKIENVSHLSELKWLNLQCNYITKIEGIITLKKLQIILLGSNQIAIFQGFDQLPELQEIHLENNKIENLGKALSMKHLRKIKLEDNPGLKEENTESYIKLLEVIESKSKGIEKPQENCEIF